MRKAEADARAVLVPLKRAWTRCLPEALAVIVREKLPSLETWAVTRLTVFHLPFWRRWTTSETLPLLAR